jgi:hypothetical protein
LPGDFLEGSIKRFPERNSNALLTAIDNLKKYVQALIVKRALDPLAK